MGWETFWDSVKFKWDSTFANALGPRDAIEIKPKSNTVWPCSLAVITYFVELRGVYLLMTYFMSCYCYSEVASIGINSLRPSS